MSLIILKLIVGCIVCVLIGVGGNDLSDRLNIPIWIALPICVLLGMLLAYCMFTPL